MKRLLVFVFAVALLTECAPTTFYQLIEVKGLSENSVEYKDENCIISYDFWSNYGTPGFTIYNSGDKNVYIDLSNSFFSNNDYAYDYFRNREFGFSKSTRASNNATKAVTGINYDGYIQQNKIGAGISESKGESVTFKEKEIICIPPKTKKYINEYPIIEKPFKFCEMRNFPSNGKQIKSLSFDSNNSPQIFGNIILYKVEDSNKKNVIENKFYVSKITNYPSKKFISNSPKSKCPDDLSVTTYVKAYNFKASNKFFVKYSSSNISWIDYSSNISQTKEMQTIKNGNNQSEKEESETILKDTKLFEKVTTKPKIGEIVYFHDFYKPNVKTEAVVIGTYNSNWVKIEYKNLKEKTKTKKINVDFLYKEI